MGVGLSPTILPAAGKPTFELGPGEMEIGMGIHGEPGVRRGELESADAIADDLLDAITRISASLGRPGRRDGQRAWGNAARRALRPLPPRSTAAERRGHHVHRPYIGEYATSLEMAGASLTIMRLDDPLVDLLDAPARSPFARAELAQPDRVPERPVLVEGLVDDVPRVDPPAEMPETSSVMCLWRIASSSSLVKVPEVSHAGSWLCHTSV